MSTVRPVSTVQAPSNPASSPSRDAFEGNFNAKMYGNLTGDPHPRAVLDGPERLYVDNAVVATGFKRAEDQKPHQPKLLIPDHHKVAAPRARVAVSGPNREHRGFPLNWSISLHSVFGAMRAARAIRCRVRRFGS